MSDEHIFSFKITVNATRLFNRDKFWMNITQRPEYRYFRGIRAMESGIDHMIFEPTWDAKYPDVLGFIDTLQALLKIDEFIKGGI